MFVKLFFSLRAAGVPVSLSEHLGLIEAMAAEVALFDIEEFYHLARAVLVKDERHLDRFDQVFGQVFKGLEQTAEALSAEIEMFNLDEWVRSLGERVLSPEEQAMVRALGGWDKLMETLRERLAEQDKRHEGGSKWIGSKGVSPFGAQGYNPEGVRIGQATSRHRRAVKVWDQRRFRNYDDSGLLGTRQIQIALRRLRAWARDGAVEELDLDGTLRQTAHQGYLDVRTRPERRNAIKVLLLLDVGGSMDDHVRVVEELFAAARSAFKHLDVFYFHNCVYDGLWRDNRLRWQQQTPTSEVLRTYPADTRLIFVGDASMSPYELVTPGGASEHWNAEAGQVWLGRLLGQWPRAAWINPIPPHYWAYTQTIGLIHRLMAGRMYPMTLAGLEDATRALR